MTSNVRGPGHAAPVRETLGTAAGTAIACNRGWPWATYEDQKNPGSMILLEARWFIELLLVLYHHYSGTHGRNSFERLNDIVLYDVVYMNSFGTTLEANPN